MKRAAIRLVCAAALLSAMYVPASAFAWDHCGTPQAESDCPKPTPTPKPKLKHYQKPAPTPVPEAPAAPTLVPTVVPAQPAPPAVGEQVGQPGAPISLSEYCQKQPNGRYEIRRTSNSSPSLIGSTPEAPHVCAQNTPVPTSTPRAILIPVATATLYVPVQPPAEDTMPPSGPEPTPSMDDQPPNDEDLVPSVPTDLPDAGGDDGCSYYETCLED